MKSVLAVILCLVIPTALIAVDSQPSFKVKYDGGSLQDAKAGSDLKIYVDSNSVRIMQGKTEIANILPSTITEVSCDWTSSILPRNRRFDAPQQIQEALRWTDMGRRRQEGRLRDAVRQE